MDIAPPQSSGEGIIFPGQAGLKIANSFQLNDYDASFPRYMAHRLTFIAGNSTDTKVLYEEGGANNGLSVLTSGGHLWSNFWSDAPNPDGPNHIYDFTDQGSLLAGETYTTEMIYDAIAGTRTVRLNGNVTHVNSAANSWLSHVGDIRVGRPADTSYGPGGIIPAADPVGASFDGTLIEVVRWQV